MTHGERVKKVRKSLGLTMEKFGERIGIKKSAISLIENGKSNLTDANVKAICREFNVDYIWLTTGEGEMFVDSDDDLMERIDRIMAGENEFHKKLIKWCATSLDDDDLRRLEKKIDEFVLEFSKPSDRLNDGLTPPAPAAAEKETDQTVEELEAEYKKSRSGSASKTASSASSITKDADPEKASNQ